ncbi:MAG: hypothetical protein NZL86_04065 [Aquificaceae bacterium]|nr:hypothetical protein [Aquificaceae bacterium]
MTLSRRALLQSFLGFGAALAGCGGSGRSLASGGEIKFGLGDDPEKLANRYDPAGGYILDMLQPDILCFWLNGGVSDNGQVYGESMLHIRQWAQKGRLAQWSDRGYELMLITWENYDGQNPQLGGVTFGNYHISPAFIQDLAEIVQILKSQFKNRVYVALATEQSTYTACRTNPLCKHGPPYSDHINPLTVDYFTKLRTNLLQAVHLLERSGLDVHYGPCFGGWLVEFEEGLRFIEFFEPVIKASRALFFQSMMEKKASERGGYGNPQRILRNCEFFSKHGKPLHLAHYMPVNHRADVVAEDMRAMSEENYLRELYQLGLRSFSFMYYGLLKDNPYGALEAMTSFRKRLRRL